MKIDDKKLLKQSFKDKNVNNILKVGGIVIGVNIVYLITTNNIKLLITVFISAITFFLVMGIVIWFDYKSKLKNKAKKLKNA